MSSFPRRLGWSKGELSGIYSGRSDYQLLFQASSDPLADHSLVRKFWSLNCPPKVKIALWKFINNYFPTKLILYGKRIAQDPLCPRCQLEIEYSSHVLRDNGFARGLWSALGYRSLLSLPV